MTSATPVSSLDGYSRAALAKGSQSFARAAHLFTPAMRDSVTRFYAWCRHCDDVIDGQDHGHARPDTDAANIIDAPNTVIDALRRDTDLVFAGQTPAAPPFQALARIVRDHKIPRHHIVDVLDGFALDAAGWQPQTLDDTLRYAYHVAGVIGIVMAQIMGVRDPSVLKRACDLGIAFQLTNIARDLADDAAQSRCYVPRDWLDADNMTPDDLTDPALRPWLKIYATQLLDAAEPYYASARIGVGQLQLRAGWAIMSALLIYRDIGVLIRRRGLQAWDSRTGTGPVRKIARILQGGVLTLMSHAMRSRHVTTPRSGLWTPRI